MHKIDSGILKRYWEGKCTPAERQKVEEWLSTDENLPEAGNRKLSAEYKNRMGQRLWQGLEARMSPPENGDTRVRIPGKHPGKRGYGFHFWSVAAAAVIFVALTLLYKTITFEAPSAANTATVTSTTIGTAPGQKEALTLPDGSTIVLNGGSKVAYPEDFSDTLREIRLLHGEAFFDIVKDSRRPFIVHTTDNSHVKVLGTQFNICSDTASSKLEITLTEGQISFVSPQAPSTLMRPGEQVCYYPQRNRLTLRKLENTDDVTGWMQNRLRFDDAPLPEVLYHLGQLYGVEFEMRNGRIPDILFTGTFSQEPLSRILSLIEQSTDLKFSINDKKIMIENQARQ